jgi:muramoyltetrapeptide carboxypeptidase
MNIKRRDFISSLTGITAASTLSFGKWNDEQDKLFHTATQINKNPDLIIPKGIQKGDNIAITAPASPTSLWEINNSVNFIKSLGCKPIIGPTAYKWDTQNRYFSAPETVRADEFMNFIRNPEINAIICARGGYGVMRILDLLDYDAIKQNPKIILGYSDITALLLAIKRLSSLTTYHGPLANSGFSQLTSNSFKKVLISDPNKLIPPLKRTEYVWSQAETVVTGNVKGTLTGGNLSMITSTLGTPYEIDTENSILFIEEVFEEPYKIDRMLTQLQLAGKIQKCSGFIFGKFNNLNNQKPFFPGLQYSVRQIIDQLIKPMNKPTLLNFPIGHGGDILTMPIGIKVEMSAKEKKLIFLESTVTNL